MRIEVILLVFLISSWGCAKSPHNNLNAVFHHRGSCTFTELELGKVVFYLQHTPYISPTDKTVVYDSAGLERLVLLLPQVSMHKKEQQFKAECLDGQTVLYRVSLRKDHDAVHIIIEYNGQRVVPDYMLFESISQQKGFEIRFYNKEFLKLLETHNHKQLRVASLDTTKQLVMIDPGHGGSDTGAISENKLAEKDITLALSIKLAECLQNRGIDVQLTRDTDIFVPLDERSSRANQQKANLLISIHANSSVRTDVTGIETHYASFQRLLPAPFVQKTLCSEALDRFLHERSEKNEKLAQLVQKSLVNAAQEVRTDMVVDRHVKCSVGQVLLGAAMPAILVEVGFLSNIQEANKLADPGYQHVLASGISDGVIAYL